MINPKRCPAYENGRWYEFLVESDGTLKLTTSDLEGCYITGSNLALPQNFHIVDFLTDINPIDVETASNYNDSIHFFTDSRHGIVLPAATKFDWCRIYIFGYFS